MRNFKFRAWAEKTLDLRWEFAWNSMEKEFKDKEPNKNSLEWDIWYENRNEYLREMLEKWDAKNNQLERYVKIKLMITDFMINDKIQKPHNYEIIDVMQYTGLKDKNNTEIYEYDIVKVDGFKLQYYKVEFLEGAFCLTNPAVKDYPLDINIMYPSVGCQIEVVGNIYENPELVSKYFQGL